jgi:peptidyl-prolyl cis-trans isomerase SurA
MEVNMRRLLSMMAVLALAGTVAPAAELVDGVVAVVNDHVITLSDVRNYLQPVLRQLERDYRGEEFIAKLRAAQQDALNNLIERALILDEFQTKGFTIPENVVERELSEIIASEFGGDRAAFIRTLQAQNITLSQYREKLRERVIVQALRARKTQQYLVISPARITEHYEKHKDDFQVEDQIKLRMIFIKKAADGADADARRQFGDEIVAKLKAGDKFDALAKLYSDGKEAKQGGDWGWVGRKVLRSEISDVAFQLKPGQHSELVDTKDGYYILHVEETKAAHVKPIAEVRDEIEKIILQEQRDKMQEEWIKQLRAKAYVRLY